MLIFEYDGRDINVYNYFPNDKKLIEFKKKEITKIPLEERVLSAERTTNSYSITPGSDDIVCFENLLYRNTGDNYHKIECSKLSEKEREIIIAKYIGWCGTHIDWCSSSKYKTHALKTPYDQLRPMCKRDRIDYSSLINDKDKEALRKLRYFLTSNSYSMLSDGITARMEGIINITEPLYIYHLLENEQYDKLIDKDIEEQMSLFEKPEIVCKFRMEDVQQFDMNLFSVGIRNQDIDNNNYNRLLNQAKKSENILKLINKNHH